MYVSASDVYAATKLDSTVVPISAVEAFIKAAEKDVDRFTFTTYWSPVFEDQVVVSATDNTITVASTPYVGETLKGKYIRLTKGSAKGEIYKILSHTSNVITLEEDFLTPPSSSDTFDILYTATNPRYQETEDGNDERFMFLQEYPLMKLNSVTIENDTISLNSIYTYQRIGKIQLSETSERFKFTDWKPKAIGLDYWYGVYPIPEEVKRAVIVVASMKTLAAQTGGTYNVPSTYSLPEGSVTIGQAYVNIRETFNMLSKEWDMLKTTLIKYPKLV